MTDKQIIIDGVPVQDCCYFDYENDGYEDSCYIYQNECSAQNCYYKQLKRKEQECEELKEQLKEMNEVIRTETTRCNLVNILKTELDQLKAELTRANCQIADDEILQCDMRETIEELKAENDNIKETFDGLFKVQYKLADNNKKLRQCLTEIKEIAESEIDSKEFMAIQCMLNGSVDNKNKVLKQILQKISECEGNDE